MLQQGAMEGPGLRQHDVMQYVVYGGNDISCLDMFARTSLAPGPKIAPRWPNMGPRRPQDGPKAPQHGPKKAPRWAQSAPREAQNEPKTNPRRAEASPRRPKTSHKRAQDEARRNKEKPAEGNAAFLTEGPRENAVFML